MIVRTKGICSGKPRVDGTRITVITVMFSLKRHNGSIYWVLRDYPSLSLQDVMDCIKYLHYKGKVKLM